MCGPPRVSTNAAVTEIVIEITPTPPPTADPTPGAVHALQPLNDLVNNKDAGFLARIFATKGWTRKTMESGLVTYRGRKIPVDELDDLLLRLNLCRATTVRIDFEPELPSIPARLFESLFIPGLQVLQFEQPLPFDAVPALAAFVRGDPGRDLQTICINRLRLTEEAIQNLVQGLMQAQVPYIGYRFQKDGPGLEIDLGLHKPGHSGRPRRGSTGSVVVVPRY